MKPLFLSYALVSSVAFASPDTFQRMVSVSGDCLRSTTPDRAALVATADVLKPEVDSASTEATRVYEGFRKEVQKLGLKNLELQSLNFSLNEEKEWEKNRSVSKGFRARMGLRVSTSDVQRLGEVVRLAGRLGLRDLSQLSTYLSREKLKLEKEACLEEAVANARAKAERLSRSAGARLGRVLSIEEQGAPSPAPLPRPMAAMKGGMAMDQGEGAPSVESESQKVALSVNVSFGLE